GISKLTDQEREATYPSLESFRERWSSGTPIFLVTRRQVLPSFEEAGLAPGTVLREERKLVLLTNRAEEVIPPSCS
ncbi:MAG: hypothetical protein KDD11_11610, partial [Acidobacteria bacterium]|nr:hypothetical protein [Acidobacteriota bacterium]